MKNASSHTWQMHHSTATMLDDLFFMVVYDLLAAAGAFILLLRIVLAWAETASYPTPGKTVDLAGQNPFTPQQLGCVYLGSKQTSKAIELLSSTREQAPTDEIRGQADALLALAYALEKEPALSKRHIQLARSELSARQGQIFPSVAKESLGMVAALSGDYQLAEKELSESLPGLQASPIDLGNRLEAAQAALWRSYCREKTGNQAGAEEDRKYALSFADEAKHLKTIADMLDALFGKKPATRVSEAIREKWAVVVGVSNFADSSVPRLRYSTKDARDIAAYLVNDAGFKPDHIKTLIDASATRANLADCLGGLWLPNVSRPGDLVFLFISSHGTPAYKDIGALNSVVTYDTELDRLFTTSMPMQGLVRMMRSKLRKRHIFVVLDTCYSGGLGAPGEEAQSASNVDPDLLLSSSYQLLLSSSEGHERSWESKRYQNSIFTRQFINTLLLYPKYDDFNSLFSTMRDQVIREVSADFKGNTQTPKLSGLWSGKGFVRQANAETNGEAYAKVIATISGAHSCCRLERGSVFSAAKRQRHVFRTAQLSRGKNQQRL
ncbi:MAG TPA: caspase family protein [Candidatus Obscuribacterales bacterium]